ncbi:gamma-glutamylcyclotransferase YtfP [Halomonas sp. A020]|uniref:gamma-glutamylcyclotransferase family protein n=1 Tax=unclassified Halomonas TaxID=2609666 RepID=UPI0011198617|nr:MULTISPECIES: gamma-glutamylcyclotransferase [unclassified Halomonas]TNH13955.1 gamma-glutamylcyclotransferase [Halomonas sp. BL6]BCB61844.1 gamma-glutamylcyclotransferase YtfP [Halomonas sp. A020]
MQHLHQAIQRCPRVAVYGTLKRGHRNHHWLNGADMLGQDCLNEITLYDLGPYPGAKLTPSAGVSVEVYAIDAERLARLDELEDYLPLAPAEGVYDRTVLATQYGDAWCYIYNPTVEATQLIESGEW